MWPIFKVLIEFGTNIGFYGLFAFWFFGPEACGIPAPRGLNSEPLVQKHWTTKEVRVWYFRFHTHVQFFLTISFIFLEFEHSRISY